MWPILKLSGAVFRLLLVLQYHQRRREPILSSILTLKQHIEIIGARLALPVAAGSDNGHICCWHVAAALPLMLCKVAIALTSAGFVPGISAVGATSDATIAGR